MSIEELLEEKREAVLRAAARRGARNILVHDYLGVNLETAWSFIEKDLLPLESAVRRLAKVLP